MSVARYKPSPATLARSPIKTEVMSATALDVVYAQIQRHSDAIVSEERQRLLRVEHNCLADDTTVLAHQLSRQTHHNNALKRWLHQAEKAYSQILQENENRNLAAEATSREMRACQVSFPKTIQSPNSQEPRLSYSPCEQPRKTPRVFLQIS